jgi:tripartite-type tricarboxylate transporter receptor subunit TctC
LPDGVRDKLAATMEKIYNNAEFVEFMNGRGFGMIWADAAGLEQHYAAADADLGKVLKAVGLAK